MQKLRFCGLAGLVFDGPLAATDDGHRIGIWGERRRRRVQTLRASNHVQVTSPHRPFWGLGDEGLVPLASSPDNGGEIEDRPPPPPNPPDPELPEPEEGLPCPTAPAGKALDQFDASEATIDITMSNPALRAGRDRDRVRGRYNLTYIE